MINLTLTCDWERKWAKTTQAVSGICWPAGCCTNAWWKASSCLAWAVLSGLKTKMTPWASLWTAGQHCSYCWLPLLSHNSTSACSSTDFNWPFSRGVAVLTSSALADLLYKLLWWSLPSFAHLNNTLYPSSLWSDLSFAAELVIADSKLVIVYLCLKFSPFLSCPTGHWISVKIISRNCLLSAASSWLYLPTFLLNVAVLSAELVLMWNH